MSADSSRPRRPAGDQEPTRQGDGGEARLWHIGTAMAVSFTVAVVGLVGLAGLAWVLLGVTGFRRHGPPALHDTVGILQLVFASVAGAGALVALIVAYRRQKIAEADSTHDRTRVFNERFTTIAAQLGDAQPAVRLAGVHAMAGLADDWKANRPTCVDVLCAYLRLPYEPDPGEEAPASERLAFRASREVRHTVIRVITAHLRPGAALSWQGLNFDFTGVVFDGGSFGGAEFAGDEVSFDHAEFTGDEVSFDHAKFTGRKVSFDHAKFTGRKVSFDFAEFTGREVGFDFAEFTGDEASFGSAKFAGREVSFDGANFSGREVSFSFAKFTGREVRFEAAEFTGDEVRFVSAEFTGGDVSFLAANFSGREVRFTDAKFAAGRVNFENAEFSGREVRFVGAEFAGGAVSFADARFTRGEVSFADAKFAGGEVRFAGTQFTGGRVNFAEAGSWAHPPMFDWKRKPPAGVILPTGMDVTP